MAKKEGKSTRKIGRCKRKQSKQRYTATNRRDKNKVRKIAKQMIKFANYKPFNLSLEISDRVEIEIRLKTALQIS